MQGAMLGNLRLALSARGLRQEDLAVQIRLCRTTLSRIINGRVEARPAQRQAISAALGLDPDWLFATNWKMPKAALPPTPAGMPG